MKFNEFIKEKRKNCNLTQEKAADKIGVSVNTIQNWENENYTVPRMDIIPDIAKTYKVSIYDIFRVIAADMDVQTEKGKLNEIFPDEMSQLYLTREEQDILGCYYLKYVGGKEICAFPNENYETAKIVNRLKVLSLITYNVDEEACCITDLGKFVSDMIAEEPSQLFDICNCTSADMFAIYHMFFTDVKSYILNAFVKNDEYEVKEIDITELSVRSRITEIQQRIKGSGVDLTAASEKFITSAERSAIKETNKSKAKTESNWFDFDEEFLKPVPVSIPRKNKKRVIEEIRRPIDEETRENASNQENSEIVNGKIKYIELYGTKTKSYFFSLNKLKEVFSEYIEMYEKIIDGGTRTYVRLNQKGKEIIKMIRG